MYGLRAAVGGILAAMAVEAAARPVAVEVAGLGIDTQTGSPVLRLAEKGPGAAAQRRELPIWIGPGEAQAIALELQGLPPPRPLTHDLMHHLVDRLGGRVRRVVIERLHLGTYYATLHLATAGRKTIRIDARPSDAIALALRSRASILVEEGLFIGGAVRPVPTATRVWGLTVQDLTPEIATFFSLHGEAGVLVSDVAPAGPGGALARGDVIVAVDGTRVRSVRELRQRAGPADRRGPVRLSVRRDGRELALEIVPEPPEPE